MAILHNGYAFQYVKNQTNVICEIAVQKYGYNILNLVKNKTDELKKMADYHMQQYVIEYPIIE